MEKTMTAQHLSIDQMKDSMRAPWIACDFGAIGRIEAGTLFISLQIELALLPPSWLPRCMSSL
jgi:hypothetical protein